VQETVEKADAFVSQVNAYVADQDTGGSAAAPLA